MICEGNVGFRYWLTMAIMLNERLFVYSHHIDHGYNSKIFFVQHEAMQTKGQQQPIM